MDPTVRQPKKPRKPGEMAKAVLIDPAKIDAVLIDLDGVMTDTASLHAQAWKETFDAFLKGRACRQGTPFEPFDKDQDYRRHVDGKPRMEGVRGFLAARGIELPLGDTEDPADAETVRALAMKKNARFLQKLGEKGATVSSGAQDFLVAARDHGLKLAIVTASRNGPAVIKSAGLRSMVDSLVDGNVAANKGLAGKPAPDTYLEAARRLGVKPQRAAVVEDAIPGVEAGRAGGFGLVIGIAKANDNELLIEAGADVAVRGLGEVGFSEEGLVAAATEGDPAGAPEPVPAALTNLETILEYIGRRRLAVFLDYDGTLTPIVDRPEHAILSEDMRTSLSRLARQVPVCIVTGRKLSEIRDLVKLGGLVYAGAHGFDIWSGKDRPMHHEIGRDYIDKLSSAAATLRETLADVPQVLIENKTYAVAIHYRLVDPSRIPEIETAVDTYLQQADGLRRTDGKKVFELRPDIDWDKGKAVLWILDALGLRAEHILPLYIGDDVTDEDAFRALKGRGLSFFVGRAERPTAADYRLADPSEVGRFLTLLTNTLKDGQQ
jgi:trehalose 6-phosphate phosphatase